jgi:N-methylhydantoinase A
MAAATRTHATDRGIDYRGMPLLAFGGAGPVHACMVADLVDGTQVIYPPLASVLSAFGTLVTPAQIDLVRSQVSVLDDLDWDAVDGVLSSMTEEAIQSLTEAGIRQGDIGFSFSVDMRYLGQQSELRIDLATDPREGRDAEAIRTLYEAEYEKQYGLKLDGMAIEVVNWRVTGSGRTPDRSAETGKKAGEPVNPATRTVHLRGEPRDVPIYQRTDITPADRIEGPAIVEERETTIFILGGWTLTLNETGSLVADKMTETK